MAESPEGVQSMDGGRSWRLFDWFLLPLLSLCNCRRRDANCAQVVDNGVQIDEQPVGPSRELDLEGSGRSLAISGKEVTVTPAVEVTCIDESAHSMSDSESERYSRSSASYTRVLDFHSTSRIAFSSPTTLTDLSIGSDFEAPIRPQSIDNPDSSSNDQLKLSDLPLLALWTICAHLRPSDEEASKYWTVMRCKDLYNFRNTCRAFAYAVNSFCENPANLPFIETARFKFKNGKIEVEASFPSQNYLMHPLRSNRAVFNGEKHRYLSEVKCKATFDINNGEPIDVASQYLLGPVNNLEMHDFEGANEINKVFNLSRNLRFKKLYCEIRILTDKLGFLILALVEQHPKTNVIVRCDESHLNDAPEFLTQLYSSVKSLFIRESNGTQFLGKSTAFWHKWLLEKLRDGSKIRCDWKEFTEQTDDSFFLDGINSIDLCK